MPITIKTQPSVEPVTLTQAKDHLRADSTDENALISELIKAAREHCEKYTDRPLITQTRTKYLDAFESVITLTPNLQSVTEVRYIDTDGVQQILASTEYDISTVDIIGSVFLAYDKSWPDTRSQRNAVEVDFVCGYGLPADVPTGFIAAMLLLIGHWYENREAVTMTGNPSSLPFGVESLLNPYRVISF